MKPFYSRTSFLAIFACFLWSTAFVGVKAGLEFTSPLQFAGWRFFLSGLLILPFTGIALRKYLDVIRSDIRIVITMAFLQTFLQYSSFYMGISMVPAALAAIVIGSAPLFTAMVAHFFMKNDKLSIIRLIIFLTGLSGVVFVIAGRNEFVIDGNVRIAGIFFLLFTVIISAFANIVVSRNQGKTPPLVLSSASMIIGGAVLFLFSIPFEGYQFGIKPVEYYISLGWLSFLSAAAVSIWFVLLGRPGVKVSDLNFWKFIIPVSGAILSWIMIPDEKPGLVALIGMAIVGMALIMLQINKRNIARNH